MGGETNNKGRLIRQTFSERIFREMDRISAWRYDRARQIRSFFSIPPPCEPLKPNIKPVDLLSNGGKLVRSRLKPSHAII
jgi:hypothetical protein